ncbi:hypothetical protein ACFYXP_02015 [Streptomyces sp. NPDC002466]|uniref:hypothetical protein n=1 Tax=unclassified Streptomyces TaxID=2593676 RepID=UPI0011E7610E|nr:hypothetical protein [Streptomyces sp. sk2.1]
MRPVRLVTGTAASAVTIATLGLFTAGPTAYAGDTEALRTGSASALSRTVEEPVAQPADEEGAGETVAGPGADAQFGLDSLSGLDAPSLLDSAGGLDAFSGLGLPGVHDNASGDEEKEGGSGEKTDKADKEGEESGGRDNPSGPDSSSSSGHDSSSSGRDDWSSSGGEDPAKHDGSSSGRDDSSSEHDGSSSGHRPPTGPTGHVETGVGGSVRSDTTQIAAGAGVLAVTAVGGAWLLRRRASGTQGAG